MLLRPRDRFLAKQQDVRRGMIDDKSCRMTHRGRAHPRMRVGRFAGVKNDQVRSQLGREPGSERRGYVRTPVTTPLSWVTFQLSMHQGPDKASEESRTPDSNLGKPESTCHMAVRWRGALSGASLYFLPPIP